MAWKPDICIHHFPCDDGFAAAWVVKRKWPDVMLAGTNYGLPVPDLDYAGMDILIADFSYQPGALAEFLTTHGAKSIVILDHHKTAEADLAAFRVDMCGTAKFVAGDVDGLLQDLTELDRPPIAARFDMQRSGASLTWEFCYPTEPAPSLIEFVEDRDLWRMKFPDTRAISLWLRSFEYDHDTWSGIADRLDSDAASALGEARAIERFYDRRLADMVPTATLKSIGKWKDVPVAHAPYSFASDLAHELLKAHPAAPFAAVVVDAYGGRTYSLRSEDSREDVSAVAKTFGGGGHRNAAGFRVPV